MPPTTNRSTTADRYAARLRPLRRRMRDAGAGALLVSHGPDVRYLSGFSGEDSWLLVPARGAVRLITDFRFEEQAEREAPRAKAVIRTGGIAEAVADVFDRLGARRLGVQPQHLTLGQHKALAAQVGRRRVMAMEDGLLCQRAVKDDHEVGLIKKALSIQERAMQRLLGWLAPGVTEQEAAARLEYEMRSLGAEGPAFPTIVAADANASLPHAVPGKARLKRGGIVLIDWGARYGGYCSDLTRVYALGRWPRRIAEVYRVVLEAHEAAVAAVRPGAAASDVDRAARGVIERAGYGERFGHGTGHGVGLQIHEAPSLSSRSEAVLEPGHVVTIEPGIYLPGVGGVRLERDVLVTDRGRRVLGRLPIGPGSAII